MRSCKGYTILYPVPDVAIKYKYNTLGLFRTVNFYETVLVEPGMRYSAQRKKSMIVDINSTDRYEIKLESSNTTP